MKPIFLHDFSNADEVKSSFTVSDEAWSGVDVLVASYTYEDYSGNAFVLFEKDGALYEATGGHCSCYGLEGQWEPEEVVIAELEQRLAAGRFGRNYDGRNEFAEELSAFLAHRKEATA